MVDLIIKRSSALSSIPLTDLSSGDVIVEEVQNLTLHQVAAWADTVAVVKEKVLALTNSKTTITPTTIASGKAATVIWIDPLKFWVLDSQKPDLKAEIGTTLDLSHSFVHLRLSGANVTTMLNKYLPLDLREQNFPDNSTAATAIHHVQIRLWRLSDTYNLLVPRSFSQSISEMLTQ